MENTAQQIEDHIDRTRQSLGSNLEELEQKVKSVTDWRQQFQARPGVLMGAAFVGGVFIAALAGGGRRTPARACRYPRAASISRQAGATVLDTWDKLKAAVLTVAAARVVDCARDAFSRLPEKWSASHPKPHQEANDIL